MFIDAFLFVSLFNSPLGLHQPLEQCNNIKKTKTLDVAGEKYYKWSVPANWWLWIKDLSVGLPHFVASNVFLFLFFNNDDLQYKFLQLHTAVFMVAILDQSLSLGFS